MNRGRGAASNKAGRFERYAHSRSDDGWGGDRGADLPLRTEVTEELSRSIIARNSSPDLNFDRSLNPYRGCEHGCFYCFARPTHAYLGLSPGLDFESRIFAKPHAPQLLERELGRPNYRPDIMAIGTNTDPYQPVERDYRIMRGVLRVLSEYCHPVSVVTKGGLIARDADILGEMGKAGLASAALSLTSLDTSLARKMEPRASAPHARLRAVEALAHAGCPVGIMIAPIIPALNDHEIEALVRRASDAGASFVAHIVLRLPLEVADLFREWLERDYPDRAERVMRYVRELHGGRNYDPQWGKRLRGEGVFAGLIAQRVEAARSRHGFANSGPKLRSDLFRRPPGQGDQLNFDALL